MPTCAAYGLLDFTYTKAKAVSYKCSLDLLSQVIVAIPPRFWHELILA